MTAQVIDGKAIAERIRADLKLEVNKLKEEGINPALTVILVGEDPASQVYVGAKVRCCHELGIASQEIKLPEATTEDELLQRIEALNQDGKVHGILVQLPLPRHINKQKVVEAISPAKDVDGFHPISTGRMMTKQNTFLPCTPYGIVRMLQDSGVSIAGKHAVILGRSDIVGKPVGQLLLNENATVTYCHSKTENIDSFLRQADIIVAAIGVEKFLQADQMKPGAVVIDVGINRMNNGKLCGDVDFENAQHIAGYITPVPGGVGPMTIAMLMMNTVKAARELTKG